MRKLFISIFFLGFIALFPKSGFASVYHELNSKPSNDSPVKIAATQLKNNLSKVGWQNVNFEYFDTVTLPNSVIVHFKQYAGIYPVYGRYLSVEVKNNGQAVRFWGNPFLKLSTNDSPVVSPKEALIKAENTIGISLPSDVVSDLVVLPYKHGILAYKFNLYNGVKLWKLFSDAHTGQLIAMQKGWYNVLGRVYLLDPARTPDATDVELTALVEDATTLTGDFGSVVNCVSANADYWGMPDVNSMVTEPIPASDASGNYLYDPVLDYDFTELAGGVNLYYHVHRMASHFRDALGYNQPIPVLVVSNMHSGSGSSAQPLDNAFYTPYGTNYEKDGLFVGQGTNVDLSYGGDVVMHEFTHSVINHVAIGIAAQGNADQYGINRMPLGIHEGLADYFPASLNNDPVIGAYALEMIQPGASRDISSFTKVCPNDMTGEEHADGELISSAMWGVRNIIGAERSDLLVYSALARMNNDSTFKDFYDSLVISLGDEVNAGNITSDEADQIKEAAKAKGLDICGRYVPLDNNQSQTVSVMGLTDLGSYMGASCEQMRNFFAQNNEDMPTLFQYKISVPEGTTQLTLSLNFQANGSDLKYRVYGRGGDMVTFNVSTGSYGIEMTTVDQYDKAWPASDSETSSVAEYTWNIYDNPPLPVGQDVYFTVTIENCPSSKLTIGAELSTDEIENPDAGTDTDDATDTDITDDATDTGDDATHVKTSEDGCSCSIPGSKSNPSSGLPYLIFFGTIFVFMMRRKFQ